MIRQFVRAALRHSYRFQRSYLRRREVLPHVLNARRLLGEGAEIGVQSGYFSEVILDTWRGGRLFSIDPWQAFPASEYVDISNVSQEQHDQLNRQTVARLARFGPRSCILRMTSAAAAPRFEDGRLDFVYLDAQHHYEAVREDLRLWAPKVRRGGVLAGHDYLDGAINPGVFGVKSAVDEFGREHGLRVIVSREPEWRSWFLFLE
jgi:hypothetical protein